MLTDATALELVLLFLVAVVGIPSFAFAIAAVAEGAVLLFRLRHYRQLAAIKARERVWEGVDFQRIDL